MVTHKKEIFVPPFSKGYSLPSSKYLVLMLLHSNAWHGWCIKSKPCKTVCSQASWFFVCLFFSIKEACWRIFFKLYPVNLSTDFVWILITEDPLHTLSSGSFRLFLKTHDQASTNFFLIRQNSGIRLNKKNSLSTTTISRAVSIF